MNEHELFDIFKPTANDRISQYETYPFRQDLPHELICKR